MLDVALIAHDQSPMIIYPAEASLDLPSMAVVGASADRSSMLGTTPVTAHERRHRGLDAPPAQMLAEDSAVIRLALDEFPGPCAGATSPLGHLHRRQYWLGQHAFTRLCAVHMQPDEQAIAVGNSHNFRACARFGFANVRGPFFAGTKCPSTNACAHSILPWVSNRLNNARQIRSRVPCSDQAQKRHQQVAGEPSTRGTYSRVYPIFNTQRMPLSVVQSAFRFRPEPGCCSGIESSISAMVQQWLHVGSCPLFNVSRPNFEMTCGNGPNGRLPRPLVPLGVGQCRGKREEE
jgi:hypothetical protein